MVYQNLGGSCRLPDCGALAVENNKTVPSYSLAILSEKSRDVLHSDIPHGTFYNMYRKAEGLILYVLCKQGWCVGH